MLRLLEEKGLVASSYQLAEDKSGPGRSEIVYTPTARAHRLLAQLAGEVDADDWEQVKEQVLQRVQHGEMHDRELATEMLARVPPDAPDAIRYCVEVMSVVALRLRRRTGRRVLLDTLPRLLPAAGAACRPHLSLLGGFALGVLADETKEDEEWEQELLAHALHYQELVLEMQPELCRRLAAHLGEVFAPLQPE
jgi:hypothetical protein